MHNVQGKVAVYLVGMLLRPILRGKGKVVNKLALAEENLGNPWKRESCKSVSEDRVGIGEPWKTMENHGKPWKRESCKSV